MTRERVALERYVLAGFVLALTACSGEAPQKDDTRTGSVDEAIIGGTDASFGFATSQGFVAIDRSGLLCSGTMLRPDVAITAKHCTTTDKTANGPFDEDMSHYRVFMNPTGDVPCPNPPGACQSRVPAFISRYSAQDVALIYFSDFMGLNTPPNRYDFKRGIYGGTDQSLLGFTLQCAGYGHDKITQCEPSVTGTGFKKLRTADITLTSTFAPFMIFDNTSGKIGFQSDSGSTCTVLGWVTGIQSTISCTQNPSLKVNYATYTGPTAYRSFVNTQLDYYGHATIHPVTSSNVSGNRTTLSDSRLDNTPNAFLFVTANFNPGGGSGVFNDAHSGVIYNSALGRWQIFNENGAAMPLGAKFNYWVPKNAGSQVHVVSAASIPQAAPHVSRLTLGSGQDSDPNLRLIVTQRAATNNHAVGVWFNTQERRWFIYNEDRTPMPVGASFNVVHANPLWGGFTHTSSTATIAGNSTRIDNPNLNDQPNAQFVITHYFNVGSVYLTKAVGVWYDGSRWNVFTQDNSPMPVGATFHILPRT